VLPQTLFCRMGTYSHNFPEETKPQKWLSNSSKFSIAIYPVTKRFCILTILIVLLLRLTYSCK
jgi:hypothetical protein